MKKNYLFKSISEVAAWLTKLPIETSIDFTLDQPEDEDENFTPSNWYGIKIARLFGETYGVLCFGNWGYGVIATEVLEEDENAENIEEILSAWLEDEGFYGDLICVSVNHNGN